MPTRTCVPLPRVFLHRDSPAWKLILIIILLVFATVAHVVDITSEVIVLLITTITGAALQFGKLQPQKAC